MLPTETAESTRTMPAAPVARHEPYRRDDIFSASQPRSILASRFRDLGLIRSRRRASGGGRTDPDRRHAATHPAQRFGDTTFVGWIVPPANLGLRHWRGV
jgi:hypothetical protein